MFYTRSPGGYQGLRILKCGFKTLSPHLETALIADGIDGQFGLDRQKRLDVVRIKLLIFCNVAACECRVHYPHVA